MKLIFNCFILFLFGSITICYGSPIHKVGKTVLGLFSNKFNHDVKYDDHIYHDAEILQRNSLYQSNGHQYPIVVKEQELTPFSNNYIQSLLRKLVNTLFSRKQESTVGIQPLVLPQPYPVYVSEPVVQPEPIIKTVIKEVPVIQQVPNLIPIEIPIPQPIHHQTVIHHQHEIPSIKETLIIEKPEKHTTTNVVHTNINIENEYEKSFVPTPIVEKTIIEVPDKVEPLKIENESLPPVSNQPFNDYGLPVQGADQSFIVEENLNKFNTNEIKKSNEDEIASPIKEGEYSNLYSLSDGTTVFEEGRLIKSKDGNDVLVKNGNYEFIDKDGKAIKVNWIADEQGFRILDP